MMEDRLHKFNSDPSLRTVVLEKMEKARRVVPLDVLSSFKTSLFPDDYQLTGGRNSTGPKHRFDGDVHETYRTIYSRIDYKGFDVEYYVDKCEKCGIIKKVGILLDNNLNLCYVHTFFKSSGNKEFTKELGDFFNGSVTP